MRSTPSLPAPDAHEVRRFQDLYEPRFGVRLSDREALDLCTDLFHFVYLTRGLSLSPHVAPLHPVRPQVVGK